MTEAHDIARQTAQRLAATHGSELPMEVEKAILGGEKSRQYITAGEAAAWAGVILGMANLAWQIWKDLRAMGKKPEPEAIRRELRLKVPAPHGAAESARDEIVAVVVEETMKK